LFGNRARRAKDSGTNSVAYDYSEAEADAEYPQQLATTFGSFADGRLSRVLQTITSSEMKLTQVSPGGSTSHSGEKRSSFPTCK
jgi:hypothetical protein